MDKLCVKSFHIIGFSDGANIGLHMASKYPSEVKSLIALSGNYSVLGTMSGDEIPMTVEFIKENMPDVFTQYNELSPSPNFERYLHKTKELWGNEIVISMERLKSLKVRTLVAGGDRDMITCEHFLSMSKLIPNSSLFIIPNADHFVIQDFAFSEKSRYVCQIFKNFISNPA